MKITEQARITQHLGIARRTGVTATLTLPEWEQTIADFDGLCAYCLTQPFTLLEHFLPVNIAGTHVKNCLPACHGCNQRKGNRTSDELVAAFGLATIERIQQYLASRSEQTDKPAPTLARRTSTPTPKPLPALNDLYQLIVQVAKEMGCNRVTLSQKIAALGIKTYRFIGDRRVFITTADAAWLKALKEKPWLAGEKKLEEVVPSG